MGHRVNTIVTKRTIGFKTSSDLKDIPELDQKHRSQTRLIRLDGFAPVSEKYCDESSAC